MTRALPVAIALIALLPACMPVPQSSSVTQPSYSAGLPPVQPAQPTMPVEGISGLQERQPDLCGAKAYVPYLSQPGSIIPTLGLTKSYRVVEYRGIEPQEYDPNRIVFRLDASGNIFNIDCG